MSSFISIRQTICPQHTNVTDRQTRQDRTDNGSVSIGRTIFEAVPKKPGQFKRNQKKKYFFYICVCIYATLTQGGVVYCQPITLLYVLPVLSTENNSSYRDETVDDECKSIHIQSC